MTTPTLTLPLRDFQNALKRVALACSNDDDRPVLQCVQIVASPACVRLQSADGFRLHRVDIWDDYGRFTFDGFSDGPDGRIQPLTLLLSPEQIKSIIKTKIPRKSDPTLTLDAAKYDHVAYSADGVPLAFPDVAQLFPKAPALQIKVTTADLLNAVKSARVFAREGSNAVQLHISDSIVVRGVSEETGESVTVVTPEHLNRVRIHDIVIAFNADYLIDYLKTAAESVRIDLWKPTQPAVLIDGAGTDYTCLLMPMFLDRDIPCLTPDDIPAPSSRPELPGVKVGEFDPETGEWTRDPRDVKYTEEQDAWKAARTYAHDPEFGLHHAGGVLGDDIFTSTPEPGAVILEVGSLFAYHVDPDRYERGKGYGIGVLHLTDPQPDPDAPIPADGWPTPNRHPLIDSESLTVGTCTRCGDPEPHALIDDLCNPCRLDLAELEKSAA